MVVLVGLTGCVNPYSKWYRDTSANVASIGYTKYEGEPTVSTGAGHADVDVVREFIQGYGLIGTLSFVGPIKGPEGAIVQAKKVGAAQVILWSRYQSTESGVMPLTAPTVSTAYSNGTVNAFSPSGGPAFGTYSGTTTVYGTETTYIPYSVSRYDQVALYFAPLRRSGIGLMVKPATDEQKRAFGTNQMMQIIAVRNGSPAFTADLLPGDLLLSIDGHSVYDLDSYHSAIATAIAREVSVTLGRGSDRITKKLSIPAGDW
ncbi:MAG TPA: PDZ domain-containing protein [Magnetospirillaceae bacterium]|jgi:membrane-associated protease RseP (regulator of RpoE activity)